MFKHAPILIILIVILSVFSACSGGGGNPVAPQNPNDIDRIVDINNSIESEQLRIPDNPEIIWSYERVSHSQGVYAQDNYVYVADAQAGLKIFDSSDPMNLVFQSATQLWTDEGEVVQMQDLLLSGNRAYISTVSDTDDTIIMDVSDVSNPVEIGKVETGHVQDFDIHGDILCVAKGPAIEFYSVKDPSNVTSIKMIILSESSKGIDVVGDYAYFSTQEGLVIVDINPIDLAHVVGTLNINQTVFDVAVEGNYAYLCTYLNGLKIVDISNPEAPHVISWVNMGTLKEIEILNGFAYVKSEPNQRQPNQLRIIDVRNPAEPVLIDNIPIHRAQDVSILGNYGYTVLWDYGLNVYDLTDPYAPSWTDTVELFSPTKVLVEGDFAYYLQHWDYNRGRFGIFDISNRTAPVMRGSLHIPNATSLAVRDNYAYVGTDNQGTFIIDIQNPDLPQIANFIDVKIKCTDIKISENYVFVLDRDRGLYIFDITDPKNPVYVQNIFMEWVYAVGVKDDMIYVGASDGGGFIVIDASDIEKAHIVGQVVRPAINEIEIKGNYAFLSVGGNGLAVMDISDPYNPIQVATLEGFVSLDIEISGSYAYVAFRDESQQIDCMHIIDISDPLEPEIFNTVFTNYPSLSVAVDDDLAFLAEGIGGMKLIKLW